MTVNSISLADNELFDKLPTNKITATKPEIWGVAITYRSASISYQTPTDLPHDGRVSDIVPLLFYENKNFYWRGLQAGYKFINNEKHEWSIMGRYRFFDIPAELQNSQNPNEPRGNGLDIGVQYRHKISQHLNADFELMDDRHGRQYFNSIANFNFENGDWEFKPFTRLRWKSSKFNNRYYGLQGLAPPDVSASPGSAFDFTVGGTIRYHVTSNLYLLSRISLTMLDKSTYRASTIASPTEDEIYLGFAFFNDKTKKAPKYLKTKKYIRLAHGWATPSNIGEILKGNTVSDEFNNKLTSVFYGIPVTDSLFGIPMSVYFSPGLVIHHKSTVQSRFAEYVIAFKAYYTIKWPTTWRFGFAEGLSYASEISYIEQTEMDSNGYRPSNLMNYLDFTFDVELGDLFKSKSLKKWWLGYSLHHRSSIFESSSAFGRIKGGSNYNSVYLQYHY
jgi:outer membrane protein